MRKLDRKPRIHAASADAMRDARADDHAVARIVEFQRTEGGNQLARVDVEIGSRSCRNPIAKRYCEARTTGPADRGEKSTGWFQWRVDQNASNERIDTVPLGDMRRDVQPGLGACTRPRDERPTPSRSRAPG